MNEVLTRLHQLAWGPSASLDQPNTTVLHVSGGSRLRYRLLGMWMKHEHLPLKALFKLDPHEEGTSIHLTLTSDEGFYLMQTALACDAYQARLELLHDQVPANLWVQAV